MKARLQKHLSLTCHKDLRLLNVHLNKSQGGSVPPQPLLRQAFGLRSLPECFRLISDSLKGRKVLSTNVMVVIKGHFGGAAAPQEKVLSSSLSPRSACE